MEGNWERRGEVRRGGREGERTVTEKLVLSGTMCGHVPNFH